MPSTFFSSRRNQILGSLALLMVVVALGMYSYVSWRSASYFYNGPNSISVTGEGEVTTVPDVGSFSFSVETKGDDSTVAQADLAKKANEILSYLKEKGIEEKDITTDSYSLYPNYRYEEDFNCWIEDSPDCIGEDVQDGFTASQQVSVKVRNKDMAGELLNGVGERGATYINQLSFVVDDPEVYEAEARKMAIADAKAKAVVLAEQLGVEFGEIISYYENESYPVDPYYSYDLGYSESEESMKDNVSSAAPVLPVGESKINTSVTISYAID